MKNIFNSSNSTKKGFTLVELMVVISVIAFMSSIVVVSVNKARNKAKDQAIKSAVLQFRNLFEMELNDKGTTRELRPTTGIIWFPYNTCEEGFNTVTSKYKDKAIQLCKTITAEAQPGDHWLLIGSGATQTTDPDLKLYSICTALPSSPADWTGNYCVGSSGISDGIAWSVAVNPSIASAAGCIYGPGRSLTNDPACFKYLPLGSFLNP